MLVVADLLGVPEEDHADVPRRTRPAAGHARSAARTTTRCRSTRWNSCTSGSPRTSRIGDANPRDDVLTGLATATFPDGSTPEVIDVVRVAANLFAAGQETTVRLLATALQLLGERPELQQAVRDERDRIPNFVEEALRYESPIKGDFRLARVPSTVAGVEIPAGTTLMVLNGAANRDPRRFEYPDASSSTVRTRASTSRSATGSTRVPGAPLARAEARVSIERLLDRLADITISESEHGPPGDRRYQYAPTYILRGLSRLHLEFRPAT